MRFTPTRKKKKKKTMRRLRHFKRLLVQHQKENFHCRTSANLVAIWELLNMFLSVSILSGIHILKLLKWYLSYLNPSKINSVDYTKCTGFHGGWYLSWNQIALWLRDFNCNQIQNSRSVSSRPLSPGDLGCYFMRYHEMQKRKLCYKFCYNL